MITPLLSKSNLVLLSVSCPKYSPSSNKIWPKSSIWIPSPSTALALLDSPLLLPFEYLPSLALKSSSDKNSVMIEESVSVPLSNRIGASPPTWPSVKIWLL